MPIDMNEVLKILEVTANSVRGNGMGMCASSIDWAVSQIREVQEVQNSEKTEAEQ